MHRDLTAASGYPTDVAYPPTFFPFTTPAWIDFVALLAGVEPPDGKRAFSWCELGCGQGVTAGILAATHPEGTFYGIDVMPDHIASARRLRDRAGITNLHLHVLDFADAAELDLPRFDYIVAHGVYSWVDERSRANVRRFIARHLSPSGFVYISYNTMPGWAADLPYQYLLRTLAESASGDSVARFFAAQTTLRRLGDARPLRNSPAAAEELKRSHARHSPAFFPHEYLVPGWRAFYVSEMRADMAAIGLRPIGSATLMENFDSYVLRRDQRKALAEVAEPDLRELVRDYFLHQRFRRDVFGRRLKWFDDRRRRRELLACRFALTRPAPLVSYQMATPAGRVHFDNPVSRAMVAALARGPQRLADLPARIGAARELVAGAIVLAAAGVIRPVGPGSTPVLALDRALAELANRSEPLPFLPLCCGTALVLEPELCRSLRRGSTLPKRLAAWPEFLARHR